MSNTTKRALSQALKTLLSKGPISSITVQSLADEAEVSRKTFYYHFQDIYDLMKWTMTEEFERIVAGNRTINTWQQALLNLLTYMQQNQVLIFNLLMSLEDEFFTEQIHQAIAEPFLGLLQQSPQFRQMSLDDQKFFSMMQLYGFVGIIMDWLRAGMQIPAATVVESFDRYFALFGPLSAFAAELPEAEEASS